MDQNDHGSFVANASTCHGRCQDAQLRHDIIKIIPRKVSPKSTHLAGIRRMPIHCGGAKHIDWMTRCCRECLERFLGDLIQGVSRNRLLVVGGFRSNEDTQPISHRIYASAGTASRGLDMRCTLTGVGEESL